MTLKFDGDANGIQQIFNITRDINGVIWAVGRTSLLDGGRLIKSEDEGETWVVINPGFELDVVVDTRV